MREQLFEAIRDELADWPIGSGYYVTKVAVHEAGEMADAVLTLLSQRCAPSDEKIAEVLRQPHGPIPGEPLWQRNYKNGMLESTCTCGEVLSIEEEYEYHKTNWAQNRTLKGAGEAWYIHRNNRMVDAISALFSSHLRGGVNG